MFKADLTVWESQSTTDDDLSRFDLICRIQLRNEFWQALRRDFRSVFIVFEFKNYSEPVAPAQVFITERYLYPQALRSVAVIISRKGATDHALTAAKGALREHGKLILLLSDEDLDAMLDRRDAGRSPNEYLSHKLDAFLLGLSR